MKKTLYLDLRFKGDKVPKATLEEVWDKFKPEKPFPDVTAFVLQHKGFIKVYNRYQNYLRGHGVDTKRADMYEYGNSSPRIPDAFVSTIDECKYMVFISKDSHYTLIHDLEHELKHIYNDDFMNVMDYLSSSAT